MKMLTVRLSLSIEEFEGGSELFDQVDCWFVDKHHPPLANLDDESESEMARFEGTCADDEFEGLRTLVSILPWRVPSAVELHNERVGLKEAS